MTIGRRDLAQFGLNKQAGYKDGRKEPMNAKVRYEAYRQAVPAWWPADIRGIPARPTNPPATNGDRGHG